jgi:hypothetical protein
MIAGRVVGVTRMAYRNPHTGRIGQVDGKVAMLTVQPDPGYSDQSLRALYVIERWPDGSVCWIEEGAYVWTQSGKVMLTMRLSDPLCTRDVPIQEVHGWDGKAVC